MEGRGRGGGRGGGEKGKGKGSFGNGRGGNQQYFNQDQANYSNQNQNQNRGGQSNRPRRPDLNQGSSSNSWVNKNNYGERDSSRGGGGGGTNRQYVPVGSQIEQQQVIRGLDDDFVRFPYWEIDDYDGEKSIFSSIELRTGEFKVEVPNGQGFRTTTTYSVTIKLVKKVELDKFKAYLNGSLHHHSSTIPSSSSCI